MMNVAVSPMACEAASPMITSVTPTLEPHCSHHGEEDEDPSPSHTTSASLHGETMLNSQVPDAGHSSSSNSSLNMGTSSSSRYQKPPPLHTGADWKVVLHLPEIETWLRATTERVRDLTHFVHQDSQNKHVDVHLVQLKVR